jgi:hypothetical protein
MCTDPIVLIDKILENLEILSALSLDDDDEPAQDARPLTPEDVKRQQAAKAIEQLVPRLRDALGELRNAGPPPDAQGLPPGRACMNCED